MLLTSSTGDVVELRVAGYQFDRRSGSAMDGWDENWLNISGRVRTGAESWAFRDPCLTTWEARELLEWIRAVDGRVAHVGFTEPNLAFARPTSSMGPGNLTVTFRGEAAPPSADHDVRWGGGRVVSLDLAPVVLARAADEWEREIAAYPPR